MKKIYLLLSTALIAVAGFAQNGTDQNSIDNPNSAVNTTREYQKTANNKANASFWMSYVDDYEAFYSTSTIAAWRTYMHPDSTVTATYDGLTFHNPFLYGIAQSFNINDIIYAAEMANFVTGEDFQIDSITVQGTYKRPDNSSTDTLLVQVINLAVNAANVYGYFTNSAVNTNFGQALSDTVFTNNIYLDNNFRASLGVIQSFKIPLTSAVHADSLSNGTHVIKIDAGGITIPGNLYAGNRFFKDRFAITVDFIPGYTYTMADTLLTQKNGWMIRAYEFEGPSSFFFYQKDDWNTAYIVNKQARYETTSGWYKRMLPAHAFGAAFVNEAHSITAKISQTGVGFEELTNNVDFSVYPNPSNGIFTVNLSANATENVILSVKNIVGQTVVTKKVSFSGLTNESISLEGQSNGIYFLTIENNNVTKTVKLIKE
ncbi:MAG: T9SS type A sorting domain-containing protein [Vicingus serpentipes]|nr:T9SS type A sorting domain-containing protein [Vicingus serpentipes]